MQSLALAFPEMTGAIPAAFTTGLSIDGASAALVDLKGRFGTIAASGSLQFRPAADDKPSLTGTLALDHLALSDLVGLAFGPPQGTATGVAWSSLRFGAGLVDPPRANVGLKIATIDLAPRLVATNAAVDLGIAPNVVTLKQGTATLDGGALTTDVTLRRDGSSGAVEGRIAVEKVAPRPSRPANAGQRDARPRRQRAVRPCARRESRRHRRGDLHRRGRPRRRSPGAAQDLR